VKSAKGATGVKLAKMAKMAKVVNFSEGMQRSGNRQLPG
jgi:hypothetical protein